MDKALLELIERLEKASGPDRQIDYVLCWALGQEPWVGEKDIEHVGLCMPGSKIDKQTPAYTASIDAAVALVERVLPGAIWLKKSEGVATIAIPSPDPKGWGTHYDGKGANFAVSLVLAALRAVQAQREAGR